jgi:hypothetical protein
LKELSLHILDLAQNSIKAGAEEIKIKIVEDLNFDQMEIIIQDDGKGMPEDFLKKVLDPFTTTRTTRRVGLGLPFFQAAAEMCEGGLKITSQEGIGTKVEAEFQHSHIDRAPLGRIEDTLITIIQGNPELDIYYQHLVNDKEFSFTTVEVRQKLENIPLNEITVIKFIREYISENLEELREGINI